MGEHGASQADRSEAISLFLSALPMSGLFDGNKQQISSAIPGIAPPSRQTGSVPTGYAVLG
jgi:hypothetical protein